MTSNWKSLSINEQAALIKHVAPEDLKKLYGLSAHALKEVVEQIEARGEIRFADEAYDRYLLTEYNNIAAAHFNADTNITRFFQFYLIIIGFPITLAGAVLQIVAGKNQEAISSIFASNIGWLFFAGTLSIAVVGLCMLGAYSGEVCHPFHVKAAT